MSTAAMRIQGLMILYLQKHIREKYTGDEKVLLFTGESVTKRCHSTDKTVVFARRMLYTVINCTHYIFQKGNTNDY